MRRKKSSFLHLLVQVDATILEVGVGGTYDSTNIVPSPIVTGVSPLGIDHVFVLGKTIPEIAHQKGGIYKVRCPIICYASSVTNARSLRSAGCASSCHRATSRRARCASFESCRTQSFIVYGCP